MALRHCRETAPVYQWHAHRRQALVEQAWEAEGLLLHQQIIWTKARGVFTRCHFMWQHEPCFYGWRKGKMPTKSRRPPASETTVWPISQAGQLDGVHPTQKPLEIFRPMRFHTLAGEVVLEPFSGSGVAVYRTDRLSRSLLDFAKLTEFFQAQGVAFVSVTEHFDTSTPMGRMALEDLEPIWAELFPKERARILALLLERVEFDAAEGEVAITFRPGAPRGITSKEATA